jgi:type I restriction enzyme R subunit
VVWHTQGSGKSYSMAFFAEKVRRTVPGNFTFVLMTDRDDLDSQIYKTFVGCGVADDQTPRASSGKELQQLLSANHRYVFSLIHKFNQEVKPDALQRARRHHRDLRRGAPHPGRQAGAQHAPGTAQRGLHRVYRHAAVQARPTDQAHFRRLCVALRLQAQRGRRRNGQAGLRKPGREAGAGAAGPERPKIASAVDAADLDPDQTALLERLLGKDYEVITADERLERIAADFVEHCSTRWEAGKTMLVCVDKITCGRMLMLIEPKWKAKAASVRAEAEGKLAAIAAAPDDESRQSLHAQRDRLLAKAAWLDKTIVEIIISEAQNEVADFRKWGFDIIPHRARMKQGFETLDGKCIDVESAFKNPQHPFRVAIVCAMWLTGFDVECLSTLYIDKPMRAHTLMQAIARANRRYPGKDFGLIVDYNGMLKSLREALAQYALGDDGGEEEVVAPIDERVAALLDAVEATEAHLRSLGFEPARLIGAKGFARIQGLADAVDAVYTNDESKRRFEILARVVFGRFKALLVEPSALTYAERHDNIEAIYKKLTERRDTADVSALLKLLHRIVNQAIATQAPGEDQAKGLTVDLSLINMEKLRDEFSKKVKRKATVIEDIRELVEKKLAQMLASNPLRMNYEKKYQEVIAAYNADKDRATVEETFARLLDLANSLDEEQRRAVELGLTEEQLALFDLLGKESLSDAQREKIKQESRELLAELQRLISPLEQWTEKEQTKGLK